MYQRVLNQTPGQFKSNLIFEYDLEIKNLERQILRKNDYERESIDLPIGLQYNELSTLRRKLKTAVYLRNEALKLR